MVSLTSLWMPILVSAVAVFLASFVTHMLLKYHWADYGKVPAEQELMEAMRRYSVPPGDYMVPKPDSMAALQSPAFKEKLQRGPVFFATFFPNGERNMGAQLGLWFVFAAVVSLFAGYVATLSVPAGARYLDVSQVVSTTAFMGYTLARWADVIWYHRSVGTALRYTFDGLLYGFITGGVFGWLWP
jgi:hypothetical protein